MSKYPYFQKVTPMGFTVDQLSSVDQLANHPGWKSIKLFLDAIMEPVRPVVYANIDPDKQLMLQQGLGAIYVAASLEDFVSSAGAQADLLLQKELSAKHDAEQTRESDV